MLARQGKLDLDRDVNAGTRLILTETAPLVFEGPNDARMSFHRVPDGGMIMNFNAVPIAMAWQRVPGFLDRRFVLPVVSAGILLILATLLLQPVAAAIRRRRLCQFSNAEQDGRDFRRVRVVLAIDLLALAGVGLVASIATKDLTRLNPSLDPWLVLIYALAWLGVLGSPTVVWIACRFWRDGVGTRWARIHHTALAAAATVFAWFAITWRIAGTTLNY